MDMGKTNANTNGGAGASGGASGDSIRVRLSDFVLYRRDRDCYGVTRGWDVDCIEPAPVREFRSMNHYETWRRHVEDGGVKRLSDRWVANNTPPRMVRHKQYGLVPAYVYDNHDDCDY